VVQGGIFSPPARIERETAKKGDLLKTILLVAMAGTFLMFAMLHVQESGPLTSLVSSSSQIYIHGTPVCVTQDGKDIMARIGECGIPGVSPDGDSLKNLPYHGHPGRSLPPGHPPVDQEMFPDGNRRVLI
jgi:hypothetical protein